MKKTVFSLLLVTVFLLSTVSTVFAGKWVDPKTLPFYEVTTCSSNYVSTVMTEGRVHIVDPQGQANLIIQGQVRGLEPVTVYDAWVRNLENYTGPYILSYVPLGYYKLVSFTTDEFGDASFQIKIIADELPDGEYYIQVAINANNGSTYGCTVLATHWSVAQPGELITVSSNK